MANSSHFVSLQASGPGLRAISAKGQQEPSGLIKTGQLTHPHLETCIIYSDPSLGREWEWGRRQGGCRKRWRRSMEMWSLITVSSAGHLHRTKSLAGAGGNRPGSTQSQYPCFWHISLFTVVLCLTALRSGWEQSYLTRPTRFMMNNERSVFVKSS